MHFESKYAIKSTNPVGYALMWYYKKKQAVHIKYKQPSYQ